MRLVIFSLMISLAACAVDLPELNGGLSDQSRDAPYPELLPLAPLLMLSGAQQPRSAETEAERLQARAQSLRIRAAALANRSL
jgi:hypothetical protein